ncbi:hypothetical protein NZNM25_07890 [Nitrosopumilus zosterae]|uniref:Uncharacterized protein n=1 Tax=Nitrosopumilus zosterae TaxID=718286 RepID=A0A2S2KRC2_9ARCH|nr:hypothetical protein [Nitrosopumilus zosterae]BDQ30570.1 hypothetical protein NZOSNM25_000675 [Nitrosopumilus zosterae]GBH33998.1 hypothetical protein NZNM25_07890 [Nitrosopumilus zosterae]
MKIIFLILIVFSFIPFIIPNVFAICAAETLEWWEVCNDTGPENALPLHPVLLFMVILVITIGSIIGGLVFVIRGNRK